MSRISIRGWRTMVLWGSLALGLAGQVEAGPTRYDAASKSFRMTYTYASLNPAALGTVIGEPQDAIVDRTKDGDAKVRALLEAINQELKRVTGGRASISELVRVANVKEADVVISMTGNPNRAGWATKAATDGKPGQIGLFYPYLENQFKQDVILSAVHEFCHYIFGLADEYDLNAFPGGCPRTGNQSPGCIMDNYLIYGSRGGWYGRFCQSDHNAQNQQRQSCQAIVDKYFSDRGVGPEEADPALVNESKKSNILASVRGFLIGQGRDRQDGNPSSLVGRGLLTLRKLATDFLQGQLAKEGVSATQPEISKILESALNFATPEAARKPPAKLSRENIDSLLTTARDLALKFAGEAIPSVRKMNILQDLLAFAKNIPAIGQSPTAEDQAFLRQLATDAASKGPDEERFQKLVDAAKLHIKFDQEIAVTTVEIATVLGIPGGDLRRDRIRELQEEALRTLALPGRTVPRFGLRRTLIVAPDPVDPRFDSILTQAGIVSFPEIRSRYVRQFARLVDRAKLLTPFIKGNEPGDRPLAVEDFRESEVRRQVAENAGDSAQDRRNRIQAILTRIIPLIADDQLENIMLLVPPGGLGDSLGEKLQALRGELVGKTDLRLDIVVVGSSPVPSELRDMAVRSGGSVLTVTDIDEVGAIAQRLKNDLMGGAWVTVPLQGTLGSQAKPGFQGRVVDGTSFEGQAVALRARRPLSSISDGKLLGEALLDRYQPCAVLQLKGELASTPADLDYPSTPDIVPTSPIEAIRFLRALSRPDDSSCEGAAPADDKKWRSLLAHRVSKVLRATVHTTLSNEPAPTVDFDLVPVKARLANPGQGASQSSQPRESVDQRFVDFLDQLDHFLSLGGFLPDPASRTEPPGELLARLFDGIKKCRDTYTLLVSRLSEETRSLASRDDRYDSASMALILSRQAKLDKCVGELAAMVRGLENALAQFIQPRPVFTRIDRPGLAQKVTGFEYSMPSGAAPGAAAAASPRLQSANGQTIRYRLSRFYVEAGAKYELILGLSRPLRSLATGEALSDPSVSKSIPKIRLFTDSELLTEVPTELFYLDTAVSSDTLLVYRLEQTATLGDRWVNAAMVVDPETEKSFDSDPVNFTFTVASPRPNVQLISSVSLRRLNEKSGRLEDLPPANLLGSVRWSDGPVYLEVQVLGGTSVRKADVKGFLQRIDSGSDPIEAAELTFSDLGNDDQGDRNADDGVYTASIPLSRLERDAEFRVIVLGVSTPQSRNIAAEDPMKFASEELRKIAQEVQEEVSRLSGPPPQDSVSPDDQPALRFQRATSYHFHVSAN